MKRILAFTLCLLALFLCACQPTPDHDIIVNKAEATIPVVKTPKPEGTPAPDAAGTDDASVGNTEQASATASPVDLPEGDPKASRADIPEHVKLEADPQEGVHVKIDAEVILNREGSFPVVEAVRKATKPEPYFVKKLISLTCPDGTGLYYMWQRTKSEISEELAAAISYEGECGDIFYIDDEYIDELKKDFMTAPDDPEMKPADLNQNLDEDSYYLVLPDGSIGLIEFFDDGFCGRFRLDRYRYTFPGSSFTNYDGKPIPTPSFTSDISRETAVEKAEEFLSAIGLTGYGTESAEEVFALNCNRLAPTGCLWQIVFNREIGSGHSIESWGSESFYEYKNPRSVLGCPWRYPERIYVYVEGSGISGMVWYTLTDTTQIITEDVPFLAFDEMQQRIIDQFGYEYADSGRTYSITSIDLVYGLVSEKNVPDHGLYIPLWQVTYNENGSNLGNLRYFFSAIDGSVVEPRIQTNLGGY